MNVPLREEARALASLAAPVVVTQVGLVLMGVAETLLVGPLGKHALGGVALGSALSFFLLVLGLGTLTAVDTLVAQAFGAGERERCGSYLWQGTWIALAIAVPITAWLLRFEPALRLLRQEETVVREAVRYLAGAAWSSAPMLVFTAHRGFLNGLGRTRPFMVVAIAANAVYALAAWALIYGRLGAPALGVLGAGWAMTIARTFMMLATAGIVFLGPYAVFGVRPRRPDPRPIARMLWIGVPAGLTFAAEVGVFNAVLVLMGWLGPAALAAHQIALSLASLTFMVPLGVSVAASVRVGQALGRRAFESARIAAIVAYGLGVGFMALAAAAFAIAAVPLARLYTRDEAVIPIAAALIRVAALFQVSDGAQTIGGGCLRGAADTRVAFVVNIVGHWAFGLPLGCWLAFRAGAGPRGLWLGLIGSLSFVAIFLAARFFSGAWKRSYRA